MGGDNDAKGDGGRAKHKTPKLKSLSDDDSAGAGGDAAKTRCVRVCVCKLRWMGWWREIEGAKNYSLSGTLW